MIFEACVETLEEAILAGERGAHRIELCSGLDLDGLTPSAVLMQSVCRNLKIPVMVMIRPRPGNFTYSPGELALMKKQIRQARSAGACGVVFGLLTRLNRIDLNNTSLLADWAENLEVTFHKAIDLLEDPVEGVHDLKKVNGIHRILTSGGRPTAELGAPVIREMINAAGSLITIIAAGKITTENRRNITELTGAAELHGRKIVG